MTFYVESQFRISYNTFVQEITEYSYEIEFGKGKRVSLSSRIQIFEIISRLEGRIRLNTYDA